jgi:hypothetical protein
MMTILKGWYLNSKGGKGRYNIKNIGILEESMEDKSKDKVDEGESSQQKKTHDTLQPKFSPKETIVDPTN